MNLTQNEYENLKFNISGVYTVNPDNSITLTGYAPNAEPIIIYIHE